MFKRMIRVAITASAMVSWGVVAAQGTPVGLWKTIDDASKKERLLVRIVDHGGILTGRIEKLLDPKARQDAVCDFCKDDQKGKPLIGLAVIRGVKQDPDDKSLWGGGILTDVRAGKVYKVKLSPIDGGQKLEVRAYQGMTLVGHTQTWIRVE